MGRNRKGLSYFPFDIDFFQDLKIRKLIRCQGGKAVTVYALLLCFIYKSGYYIRWDEELPFAISEQTGYDEAYIREVIKSCVTLGLFSRELFDGEGVLTSRGIQERYAEICELSRRVYVIEQFNLISEQKEGISVQKKYISAQKTDINVQKTAISATKRKVNKTKKENISDDMSKKAADAPFPTPTENLSAEINSGIRDSKATLTPVAPPPSPVEKRERTFRDSLAPFVSKYGEEMIRAFCDYWTERNKSGTKMRFEMEKTWDTARRLVRWDINNNKFKRDYAGNTKPVYGNKAPEEFGKGYWSDDI